ncbi:toll-like receptor 4 isoform X2 [Pectinophora gossypiella]|uniref:toll-like receptor 4 isoform X2 n=1 Tax=Pectinophora gossypiella TaxID=13191 RepID=UPI00214E42D8|nr:toll-like receptor 4 isoform X2 [Pectinophora gossypiella]
MDRRGCSVSLAVAVLCACCALAKEMTDLEVLTSQPTRCTYEHAYDMYGAHCAGLRLSKIPSLKGGIEILDFSDNKLQEIHSDTFSSYTSIKFLYLADNQIFNIDDDAFLYLTDLQCLDLSKNVILNLPPTILQLPSLRKLLLSGNPLIHMSLDTLASTKTIRAPLQHLDLSDCKIKQLPDWGLLPQLIFYNISHNPLTSLEAKHFAVMCNLGNLDLSKSIDGIRLCELRPVVSWFQEKGVYFLLDDYTKLNSKEFERCQSDDLGAYNATFQKCKSEYMLVENKRTSRRTWLTISGGLAGFLVGFILLLYLMHRHNVSQTKAASEKKTQPRDGDKNATAVLLNDVS